MNDRHTLGKELSTKKNLAALAILLGGLFIGSLFVDVVQLLDGSGFSQRIVKNRSVLESAGKTWVAYSDPRVELDLVTDKDCPTCSADEALVWLRRVLPTLEVRAVESGSQLGQKYQADFDIIALPALIFSHELSQTDFYTQAQSLFTEHGGKFYFRMAELGLPAGKYLKQPAVSDNDITIGRKGAPITVVEYSDFQCPYCKTFHSDLMRALQGKADDILYVFKNLPLSIHAQAENAALAAECAHEQGKFAAYSDLLFAEQESWSKVTGTKPFKDYALRLKMNTRDFAICLDTRKYSEKIKEIRDEAEEFGIGGTPATFINDLFLRGAVSSQVITETLESVSQ